MVLGGAVVFAASPEAMVAKASATSVFSPVPDFPPETVSSESPRLLALLTCEFGLILLGAILLLRHAPRGLARLRGGAPMALAPSPYSAFEVMLAAGFAFGGAVLSQVFVASVVARWLPSQVEGRLGVSDIVVGASFQLGLLAGLGHAWFWHLRPGRLLHATPPPPPLATPPMIDPITRPPALVPLATALKEGALTFLTALPIVFAAGFLWKALLQLVGVDAGPQEIVKLFSASEDKAAITSMIVLAVLVAPVVEELIFRVGLFRWLRGRTGRALTLLLPAAAFAVLHGSTSAFVPLVALAVHLALAYERVGHPLVPITAHALFNLNTLLLLLAGLEV